MNMNEQCTYTHTHIHNNVGTPQRIRKFYDPPKQPAIRLFVLWGVLVVAVVCWLSSSSPSPPMTLTHQRAVFSYQLTICLIIFVIIYVLAVLALLFIPSTCQPRFWAVFVVVVAVNFPVLCECVCDCKCETVGGVLAL